MLFVGLFMVSAVSDSAGASKKGTCEIRGQQSGPGDFMTIAEGCPAPSNLAQARERRTENCL